MGGASLFSGRPEPTWGVGEGTARRLEEIWYTLEPWRGTLPSAPPLGYRGCFLRDLKNKREWFAFEGSVTLSSSGTRESRTDSGRKFEKMLLSSAPTGTIPSSFLEARRL